MEIPSTCAIYNVLLQLGNHLVRSVEQRWWQPGQKLPRKLAAHHERNKHFQSKPTSQKVGAVGS